MQQDSTVNSSRFGRRSTVVSALLVGTLVLTAACSPTVTHGDEPSDQVSPDVEQLSPFDEGYVLDPADLPVLADWEPSTTVTPRAFSEEEAEEIRLRLAEAGRADAHAEGLDVPAVIARLPEEERYVAIAQCVTDAGYPSDAEGLSVATRGLSESAADSHALALWICSSQYPMDPAATFDYSSEQLEVVYEYWTDFFFPCALAAGVPVDTGAIPAKETFIANWLAGEQWWGPSLVLTLPEGMRLNDWANPDGRIFQEHCPQTPPSYLLYGG